MSLKTVIREFAGVDYDEIEFCTFYLVEPQAVLDQHGVARVAFAVACTERVNDDAVAADDRDEFIYALALTRGAARGFDLRTLRIRGEPERATHWVEAGKFATREWVVSWINGNTRTLLSGVGRAGEQFETATADMLRRKHGLLDVYEQGLGTANDHDRLRFHRVDMNIRADDAVYRRAMKLVERAPEFYWLSPQSGGPDKTWQHLLTKAQTRYGILNYLEKGKSEFPKSVVCRYSSEDGCSKFTPGRRYELLGRDSHYVVVVDDNGSQWSTSPGQFEDPDKE